MEADGALDVGELVFLPEPIRVAEVKAPSGTVITPGSEERNRSHQAFLFITSYRKRPLLRWPNALIDSLIEFEQQFRIFRFRHARMVERMIGNRTGTGGSPGVAYLDKTGTRYRIFGDLLEARNFLLAESRVPPLPDESVLGFRFSPEARR